MKPELVKHLALIASFFTTASAQALLGSAWSFTNTPPETGLIDVTFPITVFEAGHVSGYSFTQLLTFIDGDDYGSIGIQPRPDEDFNGAEGQLILAGVFSSSITGTTTDDTNCQADPDGVSCSVRWVGAYGRTYNYEVKNTDNTQWVASVVDTVTGRDVHIGNYTLPSGTRGLTGASFGKIQWLPWTSEVTPEQCRALPYEQSVFGDPTTTNPGSVGIQSEFVQYGDCVGLVDFHTERVAGGVENNCGFRDQTGF